MIKKFLNFINQPTLFGEIMRFVLVGGIATVIDFLTMGIVLYAFEPSLYPNFFNVFFRRGEAPSMIAKLVGTGSGFILGLIANYFLSIFFVFNEKGKSKSVSGTIKFIILSVIGFAMHEVGMWLLDSLNEWFVKILMTGIVLVYNYLTRRFLIFKKSDNTQPKTESSNNALVGETANCDNCDNKDNSKDSQGENL